MRKFIAVGAACAAALGAVGTAQAGPEASDSNGNFIVYDADFAPPATGKGVKVTTVNFNVSFGNKRTGEPFPRTERLELTMPKGTKYNGSKFPQCGVKDDGSLDCKKENEVGEGSAVIDARALDVQEPVNAKITAYNGPKRDGKPTLVLIGEAKVGGLTLRPEVAFRWTGRSFELFFTTESRIPYSFSRFDLALGAFFKAKVPGNRAVTTSLIQPPKTCPSRGWAFSLLNGDPNGNTIIARDNQPCLKIVG